MNQVLNKYLIKVIVEMSISLEFCSDEMVNQDYVIQIMESISAELQLMNKQQKEEFTTIVEELSNDYVGQKKEFVKQLCENLGIINK